MIDYYSLIIQAKYYIFQLKSSHSILQFQALQKEIFRFMKYKNNVQRVLILFTLQLIFNIAAFQMQYQDNMISPSKEVTLPPQNLFMTQRTVNQNVIIKQPVSLSMVFSTQIQSQSQNLNCKNIDWPFYRQISLYYNIDKPQKGNQAVLQIISATFYQEMENFYLFVLTSQGTIRKVRKSSMNFDQISNDYSCSQSQKMSQFKSLNQAYLYNTKHNCYLYVDNQMFSLIIQEQKREFNLNLIKDFNGQVAQVVQTGDKLYLLVKDSSIWTIQKDKISKIFSIQTLVIEENSKPFKISKIAIDQGIIYGLDKQNGIFRIASQNEVTLLKIQHSNLAIQVNVKKRTMLVTYLIREQTYIAEYFLELTNPQNKGIHLNKIYTNYKDVRNVIMFEKYFLVGTQSSLVLAMHSINRNSPLLFHQKSQTLSSQYLDGIFELRSISIDQDYPLSYMIVLQKSLSIIEFYQNQRLKYKQSWIQCQSSVQGSKQLKLTYLGLCANQKQMSQSSYCKLSANVTIDFKDSLNEESANQWKLVVILIGTLIGSAVSAFMLNKYFTKKQKQILARLTREPRKIGKIEGKQLKQFQPDNTNQFNISQIQD